MPVLDRRVHRLRLKASHEDHVRHGKVLLEDALRTASLKDETRLILVRQLELGKIPSRATATQWSQRIEESFPTASRIAVNALHRSASEAQVVYFENVLEPWLLLTCRTLFGVSCDEWFWTPALPGWRKTMSYRQTISLCFAKIASHGGLLATTALARRLASQSVVIELLENLSPQDLAPLRVELGFPAPTESAGATVAENSPCNEDLPDVRQSAFLHAHGSTDIRSYWLAAIYLITDAHRSPMAPPTPPAPSKIHAVLRRWERRISKIVESPPKHPGLEPADSPAQDRSVRPKAQPLTTANTATTVPSPKPAFTNAAGLFFLVPLLSRLGFPEFLASFPDKERATPYPWQLLQLALVHARIPEDDALFLALEPNESSDPPLGRWLISTNRLALKLTGLNLRKIIRRSASFEITPPHIDIFFRAGDADIRLRRAGLDLDPGWVPWLSRGIHFHFNREDCP